MNETKPKKMVSRNVAIALGSICIVLVAPIAYFTVTGISATNSYNNLKDQNKQLQTWLNGNETMLNQTQTWLLGNESSPTQTETWLKGNETLLNQTQAWLDGNETMLNQVQNQVNNVTDIVDNLTSILNLDKSATWVEGMVDLWEPIEENASFAGYISVQVSWSDNVSVTVSYFSHGMSYENSIIIVKNGTVLFPVLPSEVSIQFFPYGILSGPLYGTVTITYYY